ncbi:MAG: DUF911 domain-containing protein [Candidatus Altiarchaeales archaeon]|nr:DUF911 domain-containing protein [Candidatus Altiarchaeales archaeon]MBD3415557.1 DUF911 domain-containing protein [Candidatus Altiarchaeales archaeon]
MYKVITAWNLSRPDKELNQDVSNIQLRGYKRDTFLTGRFSLGLATDEIRPLSVSDISSRLCPSRRNLYFNKGKNRLSSTSARPTWGRKAGTITEKYIVNAHDKSITAGNIGKYSTIRKKLDKFSNEFKLDNSGDFSGLERLSGTEEENPERFLKLLNFAGREELFSRLFHRKMLTKKTELDHKHLILDKVDPILLNPNPKQIGISENVRPDFLLRDFKAIGDIKSGVGGIEDHYFLTCIGYALAYENEKNEDINFGIVYYLPTRHTRFFKPITSPQIYIFPIDDEARTWFLDVRNEAYDIISKDNSPPLPEDRSGCQYCKFYDHCVGDGLKP